MIDWDQIAHAWHAEQPHPDNPALKVGEYATAIKLATRTRFGGHATPEQAGAFFQEFKQMNAKLAETGKPPITPEEYGHLLDRIAPISFAFHGRPPTLAEVARHRDAEPSTVSKYYGDLPDSNYPHVTARDMAKFLTLAEPFSQQHIGRKPVKLEAARFAMGGLNVGGIADYYQSLSGGQRDLAPRLQPPVAGDWGNVRPGVGPPETGISERRRGGDRRAPDPWGQPRGPDRRAPESSGPEAGGLDVGATE